MLLELGIKKSYKASRFTLVVFTMNIINFPIKYEKTFRKIAQFCNVEDTNWNLFFPENRSSLFSLNFVVNP